MALLNPSEYKQSGALDKVDHCMRLQFASSVGSVLPGPTASIAVTRYLRVFVFCYSLRESSDKETLPPVWQPSLLYEQPSGTEVQCTIFTEGQGQSAAQ